MKFGKKTIIFFMILSCVFNGSVLAEGRKEIISKKSIRVGNEEEFLNAIDSNKKIILKKGIYDFRRKENIDGTIEESKNIEIKNIENLIVHGEHGVKIIINRGDMFLNIQASTNIQLKDISVEYVDEGKSRIGSAMIINESENIYLENINIDKNNGDAVIISNSKSIRGKRVQVNRCDNGIMKIYNSIGIELEDSIFKNNNSEYGVTIAWSEKILFEGCIFENNIVRENELINVTEDEFVEATKVVEFKGTKFTNNTSRK